MKNIEFLKQNKNNSKFGALLLKKYEAIQREKA